MIIQYKSHSSNRSDERLSDYESSLRNIFTGTMKINLSDLNGRKNIKIKPSKLCILCTQVHNMLKTPELAMPRSSKVTTVCNGRREVWTDYEQAKAYFLEMMMSADGEERDRAECVYIQLLHGLDECSDEDE